MRGMIISEPVSSAVLIQGVSDSGYREKIDNTSVYHYFAKRPEAAVRLKTTAAEGASETESDRRRNGREGLRTVRSRRA